MASKLDNLRNQQKQSLKSQKSMHSTCLYLKGVSDYYMLMLSNPNIFQNQLLKNLSSSKKLGI
jgi:hypothetical protein